MKKLILLFSLFFTAFAAQSQQAALGIKLQEALQSPTADWQMVTLTFASQLDFQAMLYQFEAAQTPLDVRAKTVLRLAQEHAQLHQSGVLAQLNGMSNVRNIRAFWILNMIEVEARPSAIPTLQQIAGIAEIERSDAQSYELIAPVENAEVPLTEAVNGREPGLSAIGAPFMWNLGYTGRNRRAMLLDTGVWPSHPAFKGRFLGDRFGNDQAWLGFDFQQPGDKPGTHGTHVIGTVLGLDAANNDTIGVAMNAYFIATDPIVEVASAVRPWTDLVIPFQWVLNPDGDTSTTNDIPDVINNSWGRFLADSFVCSGSITQIMSAVEAAGIANVFSAGNNGPGPMTMGSPAQMSLDTLSLFSIAAIDANNFVAGFSSRGPTRCVTDSRTAIKPEVSAPGVNVRSANGINSYGLKSGTSMAAPHVSGAVLLLKEAFPEVSGRQILNALYQTATDLGDPGEDNTYGMGIISLPAAYAFLAATFTPTPAVTTGPDLQIVGLPEGTLGICYEASFGSVQNFGLNVIVENKGNQLVNQFTITVDLPNGSQSYLLNHTLQIGQRDTIFLSTISVPTIGQSHSIGLRIHPLPAELDTINNHWHQNVFFPEKSNIWLFENFNNAATLWNYWHHENPNNDVVRWDTVTNIVAPNNIVTAIAVNLRASANRTGQLDYLYSPPFNLSFLAAVPPTGVAVSFSFDLAYNNRNTIFKDSLFIEMNDGCDMEWRRIYTNGGDSMKTYTQNIPTDPSHWQRIQIIDTISTSQPGFFNLQRLRFVAKNDQGGNIYITNVNYGVGGSVETNKLHQIKIYPNPTSDIVHISAPDVSINRLQLTDIWGRAHQPELQQESNTYQLDMRGLSKGIYFLQLETDAGLKTEKIILQ